MNALMTQFFVLRRENQQLREELKKAQAKLHQLEAQITAGINVRNDLHVQLAKLRGAY